MDTKLRRWENAVKEWPDKAATFGPPNWLVCEEWKGRDEKGRNLEPFEDAVERVRARYFPVGQLADKENVGQVCRTCEKPWAGRGDYCWACQKSRQRAQLQETQ